MKLYDLLDTLEPYKRADIYVKDINYLYLDHLLIAKGESWNGKKKGWCFYASSSLDIHVCHTPQDRSRNSERNTSGEAYTVVYKRWKCLIKRIKEEYKNVEVELLEVK